MHTQCACASEDWSLRSRPAPMSVSPPRPVRVPSASPPCSPPCPPTFVAGEAQVGGFAQKGLQRQLLDRDAGQGRLAQQLGNEALEEHAKPAGRTAC